MGILNILHMSNLTEFSAYIFGHFYSMGIIYIYYIEIFFFYVIFLISLL